MRARQVSRRSGFTLIELLVALAIFGVLAILAYGGLSGMLNTRALTDAKADALRDLQLAYRTVQRDIEQWVPRDIRDEFGESRPALIAGNQIGVALELTRGGWRNPAEQPRSTLQRVAYGLRDGELLRSTWLNLDRDPNAAPQEQVLLAGVNELRLRVLDPANAWQEIWPAPGTPLPTAGAPPPLPPRAVELILDTEVWGELRWLFRLPG
ncbi:MAG: type II secretion system minor pseudopilin GspJ [Gammaproteobacteria bacterium]